ncbi:MAG: CHAD domain-containing protein [Verrucomicrobiae bacterium]|nr:CHAD domain-containing protein [Verrucomicrobiae bacterium]
MNPPLPALLAAHLAASLRGMRRRYRRRLARCQARFSEDSVHELRIETRRMLALLDLFRALGIGDSLKKLRRVYNERLDAFDELRDTHVQLLLLKPRWADFPEARALESGLQQREQRLTEELRRVIRRMKPVRLERRLKAIEKELRKTARAAARGGANVAATALREVFASVLELRRQVDRRDTETIHRLRVAFKRFRYLSELLQPLFPRLTNKRLRRMQDFQTLMGDIQDLEVLLAGVAQAVEQTELPTVAVRRLGADLKRKRRTAISTFLVSIDDLLKFTPEKWTGRKSGQSV